MQYLGGCWSGGGSILCPLVEHILLRCRVWTNPLYIVVHSTTAAAATCLLRLHFTTSRCTGTSFGSGTGTGTGSGGRAQVVGCQLLLLRAGPRHGGVTGGTRDTGRDAGPSGGRPNARTRVHRLHTGHSMQLYVSIITDRRKKTR